MPARDLFGANAWTVFNKPSRVDVYALKPEVGGQIVGSTAFASSARRDPQTLHRIWSFMQDHETFGPETPAVPPVPQYLIRYSSKDRSVDLALDVERGFMSLYWTGRPDEAKWISIVPAKEEIMEQLDHLFEIPRVRDLRPNSSAVAN